MSKSTRYVSTSEDATVTFTVSKDPTVEAWCRSFIKHIAVVKRLRRNAVKLELKRRRKKSGR